MPPKKSGKSEAKAAAAPAGVLSYALASARTMLGDGTEGVLATQDGDVTRFSFKGRQYAALEPQGDELVVTFLRPAQPNIDEKKLAHYQPAETPGWISLRRPLSRDPRPWLEA